MKKLFVFLLCGILIAAGVTVFAADYIRLIINGVDVTGGLDVRPQVIDDEVLVPIGAIAEALEPLGVDLRWDEDTNAVFLYTESSEQVSVSYMPNPAPAPDQESYQAAGEALVEAWDDMVESVFDAGRAIRDSFWRAWNSPAR